jgi:amino acid transporter/mannitol/fructose-specific phosphotransferase system IIA component (Ntr-type)
MPRTATAQSSGAFHGAGARSKAPTLEKQLGLWDVYALATGATLSSGFFLLPGLAAAGAGSALSFSYVLAAAILLPGLLCHVELATAMPKAGGIYYFLDRSLGPLVGTIGGLGTWIALIFKSAFALIGIGAYLQLFAPELQMGPVAAGLAVLLGVINYFGTKKSGSVQGFLLIGLLTLLAWFCGLGALRVEIGNFGGIFDAESAGIISTAGLVVVSYMGLTKVVGVAEEVKAPERNLPLGILLAFGTVVAVFAIGTSVMVGVVGVDALANEGGGLTPVATVAGRLAGPAGSIIMTVAAVLAFASAANAGILSASRYPLAMGRDRLVPTWFTRIGKWGTPTVSIAVTVLLVVLSVTLFDPTKIAKLASAFKLVVFALACLAVIVMRESLIEAYDPGYRTPWYPALHITGVLAPLWLVVKMGLLPTLFTAVLAILGATWYNYYARGRLERTGAIFHIFERLGRRSHAGLDTIRPAGRRSEEPQVSFTETCRSAHVLDLKGRVDFEALAAQTSELLARHLPVPAERLRLGFLDAVRDGATPIGHGVAIPHLLLDQIHRPALVIARVEHGVQLIKDRDLARHTLEDPIQAVFFLVGSAGAPHQHLHTLSQIAGRVDQPGFKTQWLGAQDEMELRQVLTRDEERLLVVTLRRGSLGGGLVGTRIRDLSLPDEALIATIRRASDLVIPQADTVFRDGDRVTVVGGFEAIAGLRERIRQGHFP